MSRNSRIDRGGRPGRAGLVGHRNWWPGVYRNYCEARNCEPLPAMLAYHTSYETVRADLKVLSDSA